MDLRKETGEVNGNRIIDRGDHVKITFFENNNRTTVEGVLIKIDERSVRINGTTPVKDIPIDNIIEIKKC